MTHPTFLSIEQVHELHDRAIAEYGGSMGLRDPGLLESAIAQPAAQFGGEYLHPTPHDMAAAYLFHLCQNHPYRDGNKRVALAAALTFLRINGWAVSPDADALEDLTLRVARSELDKPAIAAFFREHVRAADA